MSLVALAVAVTLSGQAGEMLDTALDAVEPPPALRATFRATLSSDKAVRRIEYDPYAAKADRFRVTYRSGDDEELDAVVSGWRDEGQADARLFADNLRQNLGEGNYEQPNGGAFAVEFKHKISPVDGPVDRMISARMTGRLTVDPKTSHLTQLVYSIDKPIKIEGGAMLTDYQQTLDFGYSNRWGVSYVSGYELVARGGRFGFEEERTFKVQLNDIAFGLAGDAKQELASRNGPEISGLVARYQQ